MKISRMTIMAAIGALALVGSLSLPASAATAHIIVSDASGSPHMYVNSSGGVELVAGSGDITTFTILATMDTNYYDYQDTSDTSLCLQANVADTVVTTGGCDTSSTRQYFHWDGTKIANLAYQTILDAVGSSVELKTSGSGATFEWDIID
jgi:hypothetical protein